MGFIADPSNRLTGIIDTTNTQKWRNPLIAPHGHMVPLGQGSHTTLHYHYTPQKFDSAIESAQQDGIWTSVSQAPTTEDLLRIVVAPLDYTVASEIQIIIEMSQIVQMRQFTTALLTDLCQITADEQADAMGTDS